MRSSSVIRWTLREEKEVERARPGKLTGHNTSIERKRSRARELSLKRVRVNVCD